MLQNMNHEHESKESYKKKGSQFTQKL